MKVNFNTYVINLEKDKNKWKTMVENFKNTDIDIIRFNAIYGRNINKSLLNTKLKKFCKYFCPNPVVGCGLSHILLSEHFLKNDNNDFCLVLEDDVTPLFKNIKNEIYKIIYEIGNKKWDVIKLCCFGYCNYDNISIKNKNTTFSTASYLLSRRGANKIKNIKLFTHIDLQYNFHLNIYISKYPIFITDVSDSETSEDNKFINNIFTYKINDYTPPLSWIIQEKVLMLPYINFNITVIHLIILLVIIIMIYNNK